jgi:pectate lyase
VYKAVASPGSFQLSFLDLHIFIKMKVQLIATISALIGTAACKPTAKCDFGIVGYAKTNPIGETTGGAKGPTTKVTSQAALISAVAVSHPRSTMVVSLTVWQGTNPLTIYVEGNFNLSSRLKIGSNKSLIGTKKGASFTGVGTYTSKFYI